MNRRSGMILVLALAGHLLLALSSIRDPQPLIYNLHNDTIHRVGRAADFFALYHAGVNLKAGGDPYANNLDGVTPYYYVFRYLPAVAYAGIPLTALSPATAYLLWILILEGVLAALLVVLWRQLPPDRWRVWVLVLLLLSSPYFLELFMGQFTFVSVALLCLGLMAPRWGALYVVSVLVKPMGLAVWPVLLRRRSLWWLVGVSGAAVLLTTVPYFRAHPDQWRTFYAANILMEGGFHSGNYGLVYLQRLLVEDAGWQTGLRFWIPLMQLWRNLLLGGTAAVVLVARRDQWRLAAPALLLAHFLSYQHVWEHHLSAVVVLGAVALTAPELGRRQRRLVLASLLLLAVPSPFGLLDAAKDPRAWNPAETWPHGYSYLNLLPKVVPTAVMYAVLIQGLLQDGWRRPREILAQLRSV